MQKLLLLHKKLSSRFSSFPRNEISTGSITYYTYIRKHMFFSKMGSFPKSNLQLFYFRFHKWISSISINWLKNSINIFLTFNWIIERYNEYCHLLFIMSTTTITIPKQSLFKRLRFIHIDFDRSRHSFHYLIIKIDCVECLLAFV